MESPARWLVLFVLSLLPLRAGAQPQGSERDRARTFLVVRITDALKLSDPDALKVSAVIRKSDERRLTLVKQREGLEDRLRTSLAMAPQDPAALSKLIAEGNDLDQKLALMPEETFGELQKILTLEQQAKLLLFRRELQGEVQRALQGRIGGAGSNGRRPAKRGGKPGQPAAGE